MIEKYEGATTVEEKAADRAVARPAAAESAPGRTWTWESLAVVPLLLILLLGATLRFTGLTWDDNHHLHPDERFLTTVANRLETVSDPLTYLRTSESPLNPYNLGEPLYVYGNFPMTVVVHAAGWVQETCTAFTDLCAYDFTAYDGIHLVGRFFSAFVDLISIFFIFLVGRRLYDWRVGLLAALLLALAVMPIQQSHFFTMDNWAAAFTTVTLYTAVRAAEAGQKKRWWVLFGLFLGLAVASRINIAPLAALAVVAAAVWLARRERSGGGQGGWAYLATARGSADLQRAIIGVLLAAVVSFITFRLAQPYAFADSAMVREAIAAESGTEPSALRATLQSIFAFNPQWRANLEEIQGLQSPEAAFPPAYQWTSRTPLLFPLTNMVLYGMGLAAGIAAWLGFLWALWRIVRARPDWTAHALPVAWTGGYFLFMGTRWVKSIRYFLPIYPFLLLLAAWALWALWQRAGRSSVRRGAVAALVALVVVPTFLWANAFVDIYRRPLTRVAASRWMFENIPTGATLLYGTDSGARTLQLPLKEYQFQPDGRPLNLSFTMPEDGVLDGVRFNYLSAPDGAPHTAALRLSLADGAGQVLAAQELDFAVDEERRPVQFDLEAAPLRAGTTYILRAEHGGGPVSAGTSRIVNEEWDDLLPVSVDGKAAYAAYFSEVSGGQRPLPWPASEEKRQLMLQWLEEADVIALSSQRSLWSTPRLPLTFPLNIAYYEALFNGELGFELAAPFHADLHVGPLYISDTGGELGWGRPPEIGWPPPGKLAAEEAFSVYDHPPVWIFRKTDAYSGEKAAQILNAVDLDKVIVMNPGEATRAPNGLMLSTRAWTVQRNNGTFSKIFNVNGLLSRSSAAAAVVWWLSVVVLGWLAFPITFVVLGGLPGRGYAFARILALLLISWFGWFSASVGLLPHTRRTLALGVLLVALLSGLILVRRRDEVWTFVRQNLAYIGLVEIVGLALFVVALLIRLGNPDVWDVIWGGEKPMDLAYFNAVLKSTTFPPYDPWYAGGYINYYYYGFVFVGALTKLLAIVPTMAYNLILPMLFSFTGLGAFSLAYNLVWRLEIGDWELRDRKLPPNLRSPISKLTQRALLAGMAAVLLAVVLGNLGEVGVLVDAMHRAGDSGLATGIGVVDGALQTADGALDVILGGEPAPISPGDWFWTTTRAINSNEGEVAPITEFPFFTFLYGDLHAHMIALPLTLLALAWAISLVLRAELGARRPKFPLLETALLWFTGGLAIGVLRATNTWDWPTYLFLGCLAVAAHAYLRHGRLSLPMLGQATLQVVGLVALSLLTFWPFIANYGTGYESFRLWDGSNTYVGNYLVIYGLFLFLVLTHLARELRAWSRTWTVAGLSHLRPVAWPGILALFLYVALIFTLLLLGYWVAPIVLTLTIAAGVLGLRPGLPAARRIILILISAALGLTLLVELIALEGDIGRMNTVFKFYMQVWVLLSVAGGAAFGLAWPAISRRWSPTRRRLWQGALALLLAFAALYPLLATRARWEVRMSKEAPLTLDGMAFMKTTSYADAALDGSSQTIELVDEYEALRWLQRSIAGSPVVAEATPPSVGEAYRSIGSRVTVYTGLPTVLGWDWHQTQQRAALPNAHIRDRMNDVSALYNTTNVQEALDLIKEYDIRYIYVGSQESLYYHPQGLLKFDGMVATGYLQEVFRNRGVTIYEVVQRG